MPGLSLQMLIRRFRDTAGPTMAGRLTDAELLDRWVAGRDEAALEVLVWRHGPMVLGVCRRVLRHPQDAEDAFQATFLALVKRAAAVRQGESLGGWLFRVAHRAALAARKATTRLPVTMAWLPDHPAVPETDGATDFWSVIDEELDRLPDRYRLPFLLCCLQGRTNEQAARELNWPVGTVATRLRWARQRLATRLARRGLTLSVLGLAVVLPARGLVAATLRAAGDANLAPPAALSLARGVIHAMFLSKIQTAVSLVLAMAVVVAVVGFASLNWEVRGQDNPKPAPSAVRSPLAVNKASLLKAGGGTAESEAAVAAGLAWLIRHQAADGHWSVTGIQGAQADVAGTGLALLPLLGAGFTHQSKEDEEAARCIGRGLKWLLARQTKEGDFSCLFMYSHALAAMALCHAFGLSGDAALEEPAQRALNFIVAAQGKGGGWRYTPGQDGDTSVTAWQVQALWIGQAAGLAVKKTTLDGVGKWLDSVQTPQGGYGYVMPRATPTMTAAGLLCRQLLGSRLLAGSVALVRETAPGSGNNLYHDYYATQALFLAGGREWHEWNARMRDLLVQSQATKKQPGGADDEGSWPAAGDQFGRTSGRVYTTALALLTLQVYYRSDLLLLAQAPLDISGLNANQLWEALAGADLASRRTVLALARDPKRAVALVRDRVSPVTPLTDGEARRLGELIRDLDSDVFATRDRATGELNQLGARAEGLLRKALEGQPSPEVTRRLRGLLEKLEGNETAERGRTARALALLEQVGTPEARAVLEALAKGTADAWLTRQAREALAR